MARIHFLTYLLLLGYMIGVANTLSTDVGKATCDNSDADIMMSDEKRLINDLMYKYQKIGKSGRPVLNTTDTVTVYFGLGLIQLALDEKNKILSLSMWIRYNWKDDYLRWNVSEYGGVTTIRLEHELVWIPDVTLYNTADVSDAFREALVVVAYDGSVHWYPHAIHKSSCAVDVTNFPYDRQQCHMWFGSWTHTSKEIDLQMAFPGGMDLSTFRSDYKESCAWEIISVKADRAVMPSEETQPNFAVVRFNITMGRKFVFSSYILTLPCVFLACLTLVVFWLPPERPDRIGLAMAIFSSFMLLLLILVEAAPPTASSVPKLGVYYCFNLVIIMVSIILSSFSVNISRGFNQPVPTWLFAIANSALGRILCIRYIDFKFLRPPRSLRDNYKGKAMKNNDKDGSYRVVLNGNSCANTYSPREELYTKYNSYNLSKVSQMNISMSNPTINDLRKFDLKPNNLRSTSAELLDPRETLRSITKNLKELDYSLKRIQTSYQESSYGEMEIPVGKYAMQWKQVATLFDRFCFIVYIFLIIGSLTSLFPRAMLMPDD